jgi:hypothetical protein
MQFEEIITVDSENHTKLLSTLCGQNAELLIVKAGGAGQQLDSKGLPLLLTVLEVRRL